MHDRAGRRVLHVHLLVRLDALLDRERRERGLRKLDDGKFTWLKWKMDSSEKVTLSPSPEDTQNLIDAMAGGSQLLVDITPYSEGPVTVTYELAGFADALETLKAACQ